MAVKRRVFFSFNFKQDAQRVAKIKNIGVVQGQKIVSANDWEKVKRGGDAAIKRWIDAEMAGKTCLVVLIGSRTAGRRWVEYEIKKAWAAGLGLVGVRIHNLTDLNGYTTRRGRNPFSDFTIGTPKRSLDTVVNTYDPLVRRAPPSTERSARIFPLGWRRRSRSARRSGAEPA